MCYSGAQRRTIEPVTQAVTLVSISQQISTFSWGLPQPRRILLVIKEEDQRLRTSQARPFKKNGTNWHQCLTMGSGNHPALNKQPS